MTLHEKNFTSENVVNDLPTRKIVVMDESEGEMSVRIIEKYADGDKRITDYYGVQAQRAYSDHCRLRRQQHI